MIKPNFRLTTILLLLSIVALPWYVMRFRLLVLPSTVLEVMIALTILSWLVESQWWRRGEYWWNVAKRHWLVVSLLVIFVIAASLAVVVSADRAAALGLYKAYIVEPLLLAVVAIDVIMAQHRRWWQVLWAWQVAGLQVVLVGLSQWMWRWPDFAPAELSQGRISSIYDSANAVGLFLGPLVMVNVGLLLSGQLSASQKRLVGGLSLAYIVVIGLSQSRGALLSLAVLAIITGIVWLWRAMHLPSLSSKMLSIGAAVIVIGYTVLSLGFVWFFNHPPTVANPYTRPGFSTFTVRQCLWQGTKGLLESQPMIGSGLAGFSQAYLPHLTCDAEPLVYPHMLVLNFWTQLGLLGLAATLGLAMVWLLAGFRLMQQQFWLGFGLTSGLLYWLIHGLVDVPFFKNDLSVEWWLLAALTATAGVVFARISSRATETA